VGGYVSHLALGGTVAEAALASRCSWCRLRVRQGAEADSGALGGVGIGYVVGPCFRLVRCATVTRLRRRR